MPLKISDLKTVLDKFESDNALAKRCTKDIIKLKEELDQYFWNAFDNGINLSEEERAIIRRVEALSTKLLSTSSQADISSHQMVQSKKSAIIFGSFDQSAFYQALDPKQVNIIQRFQQSGLKGFLPLNDPGVCAAMCTSFAYSLRHGGLREWQGEIATRDPVFIQKLKEEQNKPWALPEESKEPAMDTIIADILEKIASGVDAQQRPRMTLTATNAVIRELVEFMDPQKFKSDKAGSCLDAPQMQVNCYFERTGWRGKGKRVNHAILFSMAVDEKGNLDPNHLLCMDANAGIFKIQNTLAAIQQFMDSFDQHLAKEMTISHYDANFLPRESLSPEAKDELAETIRANLATDEFVDISACNKTTSYRTAVKEMKPGKPEGEIPQDQAKLN